MGLARRIVVVCCLAVWVGAAAAQSRTALVCTFIPRHTASLGAGYKVLNSSERLQFTFAAIDAERRSAQFIGNAGAAEVTALILPGNMRFVEITPSGNIMITSVFGSIGDDMPAVHSRHTSMGSTAVVSQYTGTCAARN